MFEAFGASSALVAGYAPRRTCAMDRGPQMWSSSLALSASVLALGLIGCTLCSSVEPVFGHVCLARLASNIEALFFTLAPRLQISENNEKHEHRAASGPYQQAQVRHPNTTHAVPVVPACAHAVLVRRVQYPRPAEDAFCSRFSQARSDEAADLASWRQRRDEVVTRFVGRYAPDATAPATEGVALRL